MGVEFQHWLLVRDLGWLPAADTAHRVTAVLGEWGLGDQFVVTDLDDIEWDDPRYGFVTVPLVGYLHELPALPANAMVQALGDVRGPAVHRIVGPSRFDGVSPDDQYIQRLSLVLGQAFRVFRSWETGYTTVLEPARDHRGDPVEPLELHITGYRQVERLALARRPWTANAPQREQYPSPPATAAPRTEFVWQDGSIDPVFSGCFRSALGLDLGKSLAAALDGASQLPNRAFVAALEEAFDTELVEAGHYY